MTKNKSLRKLIEFLNKECLVTQGELAEGLGISRAVVSKYFSDKENYVLPIVRENIISLFNYIKKNEDNPPTAKGITDAKLSVEEKEKKIKAAMDFREQIASVDEFLEMAGYLPEHNKNIQVSTNIFQMVLEIATELELLSVENAQNLSFDFKSLLHTKSKTSSQTDEDDRKDYLDKRIGEIVTDNRIPLTLIEKLSIKQKLQKVKIKLEQRNKKTFTEQEALALFISIAIKEKLLRDLEDISIRLEKVEYQTLSFSINSGDEFKDLHQIIWGKIARQEEWKLVGYTEENKMLECDTFHESEPVLLAKLTCIFRYKNQAEKLTFTYTSNNTFLENGVAAIGLNLGFSPELGDINFLSTKVISTDKNGLVETTVLLKEKVGENDNKYQYYQATWVDIDTFKSTLQAILSASIHWLSYHARDNNNGLLQLGNYQSLCVELTKIRHRAFNARRTLNDFQFLDDECGDSNITGIVDDAINQLKKLEKEDYLGVGKITEAYRINFYLCYLEAQIIRLRRFNTQGNIQQVTEILNNIKETQDKYFNSEEMIKNNFANLMKLRDVEDYLYKFSIGHEDVFNLNNLNDLKKVKNDQNNSGKENDADKDAGLDVYTSLSEVYGNVARFQFYLSDDKDTLIKARENFLKAAYHASRMGAKRRTAKWITFAGRVNVRLGSRNNDLIPIEQYLYLSKAIISKGVSAEYKPIFRDALESEINLLRGELHFMGRKYEQAFYCFLLALKGSIFLGFNRRISDSLYNLHRCYKKLGGTSIRSLLEKQESCFQLHEDKRELNPQSNAASEAAIDLVNNYLQNVQNSESFQNNNSKDYIIPTDSFLNTAKGIWTQWYRAMTDSSEIDSQHPVAILMDQGKWLSILED